MQGTTSAKGHQGQLPRVVATTQRDQLQRVHHIVIGQAHHTTCDFISGQLQALAQRAETKRDCLQVGDHLAAAEVGWVDPPQGQIGIGGGNVAATLTIRRRPGLGAGRLGTDM